MCWKTKQRFEHIAFMRRRIEHALHHVGDSRPVGAESVSDLQIGEVVNLDELGERLSPARKCHGRPLLQGPLDGANLRPTKWTNVHPWAILFPHLASRVESLAIFQL